MKENPHACKGCKFYYLGDYLDVLSFYNALTNAYEQHSVKVENKPCCGYMAGGKGLDIKQTRCSCFVESK